MVKVLNEENFEEEVMGEGKAALVDFYADWCGPCKMMDPVVEELSEEYKEKAVFGKVNVDENPSLAQKYGVMSIPTFVVLKEMCIRDSTRTMAPGSLFPVRNNPMVSIMAA